ncbi:ubl carboxyl-terminal hydrolase 18-like isoform X2 [Nelusetta ayraudi]|uniref:ubl carboxyl-terminal hydrolase 18-like isoform X2 n=1 Tax=Nelusetta ayraudi TaxID=303726 RepID=UPI003F6F92A8
MTDQETGGARTRVGKMFVLPLVRPCTAWKFKGRRMSSSRKRGLEDDVKAAAEKKPKGSPSPGVSHGLYNQGATCYLSSVLQLLHMTPEFHDRLQHTTRSVDKELRHIFDKMKMYKCETRSITQWLAIKNVHQQCDAAECLEMILNKVNPHVSEVFRGELMYTTRCDKGCVINNETTPFWSIPLSLRDKNTASVDVQRNLNHIFEETRFSGDNLVHCDSCEKKLEASKTCEMVRYPQILTLLLKRFELDYSTGTYSKSNRCMNVPLVLQAQEKSYELYGIVNHMGNLQGGHYTSTVLCSEDDTWYTFDDTRVEKNENPPFGTSKVFNSKKAYLIVYRVSEERKSRRREHESKSKSQQQKSPVRKDRNQDVLRDRGWGEDQRAEEDIPFVNGNHSNTHSIRQKPGELRMTQRNKTALEYTHYDNTAGVLDVTLTLRQK